MKIVRKIFQAIPLISLTLMFSQCRFDESKIRVERFEYLDEEGPHIPNWQKVTKKAFLIHNYKPKYANEINQIVDKYFCENILYDTNIVNLQLYDRVDFTFYKKSKNTNRENF